MNDNIDIIKLEDVSFQYEAATYESIKHIKLTIHKGEIVLLTGESGCGKTTLIRCINSLIPDFYEGQLKGKVMVDHHSTLECDIKEIAKKVGSVFQDPRSQFFTTDVNSEMIFPCENLGMERQQIQLNYKKAVKELHIENLKKRKLLELSSGEKQKVAIASVYTVEPEIYVLDEPSANLDYEGTMQLNGILQILKEKGCTVIISEHKLFYLMNLIDRVIYMKNGAIEADLNAEEFKSYSADQLTSLGLRQILLSNCRKQYRKRIINDQIQFDVSNLRFGYYKKECLWENVSFHAYGGEVIGILGRNGAGKSSLCRVLMGMEHSLSGDIRLNGKKIGSRQRRAQSFYVMQDVDYQLFAENVLEELKIGVLKKDMCKEKINWILDYMNLREMKQQHPASLSGGQKQRLAISIAYMKDKKIIFLDEPTSGLDAKNAKLVSELIRELANKGCLIFVITHDFEFAAMTLDQVICIENHKISKKQSVKDMSYDLSLKHITC